jgi:hypothetical protein
VRQTNERPEIEGLGQGPQRASAAGICSEPATAPGLVTKQFAKEGVGSPAWWDRPVAAIEEANSSCPADPCPYVQGMRRT